jgi:hypothetical protein
MQWEMLWQGREGSVSCGWENATVFVAVLSQEEAECLAF